MPDLIRDECYCGSTPLRPCSYHEGYEDALNLYNAMGCAVMTAERDGT